MTQAEPNGKAANARPGRTSGGVDLTGLKQALLPVTDASAIEFQHGILAAVLVALIPTGEELHMLFTKRRGDLAHHAGEISFPGGRHERSDRDLADTALREAHEEVGLPVRRAKLLGALEPTPTMATGYAIYPFVALVPAGLSWKPSRNEVDMLIELPLTAVAEGYGRRSVIRRGSRIRTDTYIVEGHTIWGATARIVGDLLRRLEIASAKSLST